MAIVSKVVISGLTAAGKTTHAKLLCQDYGLEYVSASQILLKLGGLDAEQPRDFWVTPEGRQLQQILINYGVDLFQDRQPIDIIIDISSFIAAPTEESSRVSVLSAHKIISSAVGWYLFEDKSCRDRFKEELVTYGDSVLIRYPSVDQ